MAFISSQYFVYVNSNNRISGTNGNFSYAVDLPDDHNFTHVTVIDATIPKSYYLIQEGYNTFQLTEGVSSVTISVPIGNYLLSAWTTTLTGLLNANSPNGWTYAVTYPTGAFAETGKLTYTVTGNSSQPSITVTNTLYEPFGFLSGSTNTFVSDGLVSSTVIKLQSEDRILISSDICNNPNSDNILVAINAGEVVPFSTITYENANPDYNTHEIKQGKKVMNIAISNEAGINLTLNGLNMNMTLLFYRKENIMDIVKKFIQLLIAKK